MALTADLRHACRLLELPAHAAGDDQSRLERQLSRHCVFVVGLAGHRADFRPGFQTANIDVASVDVLAGAVGMLAQTLLVGVPPIDPVSFGGTAMLFAIVLALACWTPARRAAATDPATALRAE